jgi:hypothetical protein
MKTVNLTVDIDTVNVIIAGLSELPHKVSRGVIDNIIKQVQAQAEAAKPGDTIEQPEAPAA